MVNDIATAESRTIMTKPARMPACADHSPRPSVLYRYRDTGDRTASIFARRELFFADPVSFNDPFDCGFHIACEGARNAEVIEAQAFQTVRRERPTWNDSDVLDAAERIAKQIVANHQDQASAQFEMSLRRDYKASVLCFAETHSDILMWSHYADNHKGICLGFRTDIADSFFATVQCVMYSDQYPHLDLRMLVENRHLRDAATWMLTKASHWSYEREWRILDFEQGPGPRPFPPECFSTVIMGCRIPDRDRERVLSWVKHFPTPILVLQSTRSRTHFRLDFAELT
jgi:hypothetical protein